MVIQLWSFVGKPRNREILAWLGGGLIALATGLWAVFIYLVPPKADKSAEGIQATCGVAVGGNISGSPVNVANCSAVRK